MEMLNQYFVFFLIIALGLALGNVKVKGVSLDVSAVIFVALLFGHLGYKSPAVLQKIGLILFIYSVGIQAGPGFFKSFKKQGVQFIALAFIVVFSGALVSYLGSIILGIDKNLIVGIYTGAMTSTPGLAAAIESTNSPLASIGYGVAYPFGVIGVILFVKFIPKLLKINLKSEEENYNKSLKQSYPEIFHKNFVVQNPNVFNKTIGELKIRSMSCANISRVFHNGNTITPNSKTVLHEGDILKAVGTNEALAKIKLLIGEETCREIPLNKEYEIRTLLITNKNIVNKTLGELNLFIKYDATATWIRRSGIQLAPKSTTHLQLGDRVMVACTKEKMKGVAKLFGDNRSSLSQLDMLPIAIGIIVGILLGQIKVPILGYEFGFGMTGGILIAALLLSKIGRTGPIIWNVSGSVNQFLRKIGLVFFLVSVGTNAGVKFYDTFINNGAELFVAGVFITIIPMAVATIFIKYFSKMNFLIFLGGLTGSMTSTPALSVLEDVTDSDSTKIAYATVYPFALVFIILCSQLLSLI